MNVHNIADNELFENNLETTEQFKNERKCGIGGSDIAAVMGLSKWRTPLDVYNEKKGIVIPHFEEEVLRRMAVGLALEEVIRKETVKKNPLFTIKKAKYIKHPEHSFIMAHPDGIIVDSETNDNYIFEAKTAGYDSWGDDVPIEYYLQIQQYMLIANLDRAYLACLTLNNMKMHYYWYDADKEVQQRIIDAAVNFWNNHYLKDIPPEEKKEVSEIEHVLDNYLEIDNLTMRELQRLANLKADKKRLETQISMIEDNAKNLIAENEGLKHHNEVVVTYKAIYSNRFDTTRFKKENAELYEEYVKSSLSRRFDLKLKEI